MLVVRLALEGDEKLDEEDAPLVEQRELRAALGPEERYVERARGLHAEHRDAERACVVDDRLDLGVALRRQSRVVHNLLDDLDAELLRAIDEAVLRARALVAIRVLATAVASAGGLLGLVDSLIRRWAPSFETVHTAPRPCRSVDD